MARNFDSRLQKLNSRRQGPPEVQKLRKTMDGFAPELEAYQKRGTKTASTYALGAMQQVDPDYTARSFEEGDRVKNQLDRGLSGVIPASFEYQGSVPLNIHIRGVSDVDLLLVRTDIITIAKSGCRANTHYVDWTGPNSPTLLSQLRSRAEQILPKAFPEANVDISGSKAITISGGSLRRSVDVIPSHWYDGEEYQRTQLQKDRGIYIFLKQNGRRMLNYPFLHMDRINSKDTVTAGNTKKIIRLLKTLVADYEEGPEIRLSSYDIASLAWHFSSDQLQVQSWNELALLWIARTNLEAMVNNELWTKSLETPDGTRRIINEDPKFTSLKVLLNEVNDLVREVAMELSALPIYSTDDLARTLRNSIITPAL